jgi:hypothetical protein
MPYDPGYLSGWVAEQYQLDLPAASQISRQRMDGQIQSMCASKVPGDTYRNLNVQTQYSDQTFKHVLLPVWLMSYTYAGRTYQMVANGYTGKVAGKYPISWIKVSIVVAVVLLIIIIFLFFKAHAHVSGYHHY